MSHLIQPAENLDSTTQKIKKTISDIAHSFNYIGLLLWEVRKFEYYKERGYKDVYEYAEKELMFKKTSTHNFIAITERFSLRNKYGDPTMALADKYDKYNYTQLTEMLSIKAIDPSEVITPTMTKKEIREVKKELKKSKKEDSKIIDVDFTEIQPAEFGEQIDVITIIENKDSIQVSSKQLESNKIKYVINEITKQQLLNYIDGKIIVMREIISTCTKNKFDDEMRLKCSGQLDCLKDLRKEIERDLIKID